MAGRGERTRGRSRQAAAALIVPVLAGLGLFVLALAGFAFPGIGHLAGTGRPAHMLSALGPPPGWSAPVPAGAGPSRPGERACTAGVPRDPRIAVLPYSGTLHTGAVCRAPHRAPTLGAWHPGAAEGARGPVQFGWAMRRAAIDRLGGPGTGAPLQPGSGPGPSTGGTILLAPAGLGIPDGGFGTRLLGPGSGADGVVPVLATGPDAGPGTGGDAGSPDSGAGEDPPQDEAGGPPADPGPLPVPLPAGGWLLASALALAALLRATVATAGAPRWPAGSVRLREGATGKEI